MSAIHPLNRKVITTICILFATQFLAAQKTDTTRFKSGYYCVYQRDKKGLTINPIVYFDTAGVMKQTRCYKNGSLDGPLNLFDKEGRKIRSISYKGGLLDGNYINYYLDGTVHEIWPYRLGEAHGRSISYYPNGKVEWTKEWREGKSYGLRTLRDSTGALYNGECTTIFAGSYGYYTTTCNNGRPYGKLTVFHADSTIRYTGNYKDGYADGEYTYYDRQGKVWYRDYYNKGKFVESIQGEGKSTSEPELLDDAPR